MKKIELVEEIAKDGLDKVVDRYRLAHKRHKKYENLVLLKYDMIDSPMSSVAVQQARGIILDLSSQTPRVVSRPFDKFFNLGEANAATIDWQTARVQEKLDGSLCTLYHHDGAWHVASSGVPDATSGVNDYGFTFADLFWRVWGEMGYTLPNTENMCYMFELMTPYNRVVVRHDFNRLVLIGARNLTTQEEVEVSALRHLGFDVVKEFSGLKSMDAITGSFGSIDPLTQEGYVVVDASFNRVKVKHPGYVAMHHLKAGASRKYLLQIARSGEGDELLTYFPEYAAEFSFVKDRYDTVITALETAYSKYNMIPVQKDFAIAIKDVPMNAALFQVRAKKVSSIKEFLLKLPIDHLMSGLGLK